IPAAVVVTAVVAVIVVVVAVEGAAAALRLGVTPAVAVAAVLLLAILLKGPEEPEGLAAHRLVVIGGGVDLLFRGRVDSVRRGVFFLVLLRLLLEQEPEVFSFSFGLVLLRGDPEVKLLCIPVQRSQRFVRCGWVPLWRRLPTLRDGDDGRSRKGGRRGGRGRRGRVSERVGVGGRRDGHGCWRIGMISVLLALGRRWSFAVEKSRFGMKLNSKRWKRIGSYTFYEEPVAETLRLP